MGHTYTNLLVHAIFSTKERQALIDESFRERMYEYMGGIARQEFGSALKIGGTDDHVHGLLLLKPAVSVSDALGKWKSLSSGWINKLKLCRGRFEWQSGYGAFSVSESVRDQVATYIERQKEHHQRMSFEEEIAALLRAHGVAYDPKWLLA